MEQATEGTVFPLKKRQPRLTNRGFLVFQSDPKKSSQLYRLGVLSVLLESLDQQDSEDAVHFILLLTLFSDVLSSFSFVGANINNFLLTFQGKKVYKEYFFFIT